MLMAQLISDAVLDEAYDWLCRRQRDYPEDAEVWDFRHAWPAEKARFQSDLSAGRFCFGLLDRITKADGEVIDRVRVGECPCRRVDLDRISA